MKPILCLVVLAAAALSATAAPSDEDDQQMTLDMLYASVDHLVRTSNESYYQKFKPIDRKCVKQKMKLADVGHKVANRKVAMTLLLFAFHLCAERIDDLLDHDMDTMLASASHAKHEVECAKVALKELEPALEVVKDFDAKSVKLSREECKAVTQNGEFVQMIKDLEHGVGKLDAVTCGAISESDLKKLVFRLSVMKFGLDGEDAAKAERARIREFAAKRIKDSFECMIAKI